DVEVKAGGILDAVIQHRHVEAGGDLIGGKDQHAVGRLVISAGNGVGAVGRGIIDGNRPGGSARPGDGEGGIAAVFIDDIARGGELHHAIAVVVGDGQRG